MWRGDLPAPLPGATPLAEGYYRGIIPGTLDLPFAGVKESPLAESQGAAVGPNQNGPEW